MRLFARKRSRSNPPPKEQDEQEVIRPSLPIAPLELPPEISTPLYERFARVRLGGDTNDEEPATPLALFDGSSMGTKAGMRALMRAADPLEDAPPTSFFATYVSPSMPTLSSSSSQPASRRSESSKFEQASRESPRRTTRPSTADTPSSTVISHNKNSTEHPPRSASSMDRRPPISGSSKPRGQNHINSDKNLASHVSPPQNLSILSPTKSFSRDDPKRNPTQLSFPSEHRAGHGVRPTPSPNITPTPIPVVAPSRPPIGRNDGSKRALIINTADVRRNGSNNRTTPPLQPHDHPQSQKSKISAPSPLSTGHPLADRKPTPNNTNRFISSPKAMEPPSPGRHLPHLPPAPSAPPPPIPHSSSTYFISPPTPRLRTTSTANHPSSYVANQRGARGDTPPVSNSPALKRRRNSLQSADPNTITPRMTAQPAPSPSQPSMPPDESPRKSANTKQQLPTPASSAGSLNYAPLNSASSTSTLPSPPSHPPVSSSASWLQGTSANLTRDDSASSKATASVWHSATSTRTSMTSDNSSHDPHHHHRLHKATSSRTATAAKDVGRSWPLTPEISSPQPSKGTSAIPTFGFNEDRLSAAMLQDDVDPFARPPITVEHKNEFVSTSEPGSSGLSPASTPGTIPSPVPSILTLTSVGEQSSRSKSSKDKDHERPHTIKADSSMASPKRRVRHHEKDLEVVYLRPSTIHTEHSVDAADDSSTHEHEPKFYPLHDHVSNPELLSPLIAYLSFGDFSSLWSISLTVRKTMDEQADVREVVLARYLASTGYKRWAFEARREPLVFTVNDLNAYLRGVSAPSHRYAELAERHLSFSPDEPTYEDSSRSLQMMAASTRAYTRLVLRLRAQAEVEQLLSDQQSSPISFDAEDVEDAPTHPAKKFSNGSSDYGHSYPPVSRPSSRRHHRSASGTYSMAPSIAGSSNFGSSAGHEIGRPYKFRSPLFKMGHAPLLRVFVPSPEGQWLSDENVIQCEEELQLAGVISLLKVGDVVWDIAVGDEGNLGRMIWDGTYLIDLDYSYSLTGEIPPYIDSMCFPPSYWHKIIRVAGNPICHVDIRPYAKEIASNIGLLQSRVQTETPQGHHHTVIRWIHRSRFQVRGDTPLLPAKPGPGRTQLIDPAWDGMVYIEAEGTDEGLQDLQARCGNIISLVSDTSRAAITGATRTAKGKSVFRMIRGNSRPGELWLRCVREKERILN